MSTVLAEENTPDVNIILLNSKSGSIENKFDGITISDVKGIEKNVQVVIRDTYWSPIPRPLVVVDCMCGDTYKEKLFYLLAHQFSNDAVIKCPNSTCGHEIEFHYTNDPN